MVALGIKDVKHFMGKLLGSDLLDSFLLEEATVHTYNTFLIDGRLNRDFYSQEEWNEPQIRPYEFSEWKKMRGILFELIKGRKVPVSFRFVLHLMPQYVEGVVKKGDPGVPADQVKALVLTCKYEEGTLRLLTGTAFHTFVMDKSVETAWDKTIKTFLERRDVDYEEL